MRGTPFLVVAAALLMALPAGASAQTSAELADERTRLVDLAARAKAGDILIPVQMGGHHIIISLTRDEFRDVVTQLVVDGQLGSDGAGGLETDQIARYVRAMRDMSRETAQLIDGLIVQIDDPETYRSSLAVWMARNKAEAASEPAAAPNWQDALTRPWAQAADAVKEEMTAAAMGTAADKFLDVAMGTSAPREVAPSPPEASPAPPRTRIPTATTGAIFSGPTVAFEPTSQAGDGSIAPPTLPAATSVRAALPVQPGLDWAGTYGDGENEYTLTGGNAGLSGQGRSLRGNPASGQWSACVVEGNRATCQFSGSFRDDDKSASYSGTAQLTLDGDTLSGTNVLERVSISWRSAPYGTVFQEGARFPFSLKRTR